MPAHAINRLRQGAFDPGAAPALYLNERRRDGQAHKQTLGRECGSKPAINEQAATWRGGQTLGDFRGVGRLQQAGADLGMAARPARRRFARFDQRPGALVGEERAENRVVEPVAAADRAVGAEDRRAGERKVAERVERLVAHELVGESAGPPG